MQTERLKFFKHDSRALNDYHQLSSIVDGICISSVLICKCPTLLFNALVWCPPDLTDQINEDADVYCGSIMTGECTKQWNSYNIIGYNKIIITFKVFFFFCFMCDVTFLVAYLDKQVGLTLVGPYRDTDNYSSKEGLRVNSAGGGGLSMWDTVLAAVYGMKIPDRISFECVGLDFIKHR